MSRRNRGLSDADAVWEAVGLNVRCKVSVTVRDGEGVSVGGLCVRVEENEGLVLGVRHQTFFLLVIEEGGVASDIEHFERKIV